MRQMRCYDPGKTRRSARTNAARLRRCGGVTTRVTIHASHPWKMAIDGHGGFLFDDNAWLPAAKGLGLKGNPVRRTHQGATPGLYPQLYTVGVPSTPLGLPKRFPGKVGTKPGDREPEYLPGILSSSIGAGVPVKEREMSSMNQAGRIRPKLPYREFSITEFSTIGLLAGVAFTCVALWLIIAGTIGV